ncbi:MAG: helix-turn-helix transcriptional regulator [Clostridia bacterium]|nr:helix-turn-helix transcriptional regulator [Clostridia bacterium]
MNSNPNTEDQNFAILPVTIFKDSFEHGIRTNEASLNDTFKPNHRAILKSVIDVLKPEHVFTKYHYHDGVEIIRINEGQANIVINNHSISVQRGDVLVFNAFEAHGLFLPDAESLFTRTCIAFRPHYLFPPESGTGSAHFFADLKKISFQNHIPAEHPAAPMLCDTIDRIVSVYQEQHNGWSVEVFSCILQFYSQMIRYQLFKENDNDTAYIFDFMTKVSTYIEENLDQDIATTDIAAYCQYSTEHFCRLFKKCFNKTFKNYLNIYRIRRAKDFIDSGKYTTIAAVSTKVGFNNQNHFGHMFKKYVGILPSEYINRQKIIE